MYNEREQYSETQYHIILREICASYGKEYTDELRTKNIGGTDNEVCANVVSDLQLNVSVEKLERELLDKTKQSLPKAPLKKGVERLLNHLYKSGVLFALATNSLRSSVRLHVAARPQIFKMFHHMVCAGDPDVERGKPFPDLYLIAAAKFPDKPKPVKCLVFEDSVIGVEAGVTAGMQVVMTPASAFPVENTRQATLVLESLRDFKPEVFGLPPFTDEIHKPPPR